MANTTKTSTKKSTSKKAPPKKAATKAVAKKAGTKKTARKPELVTASSGKEGTGDWKDMVTALRTRLIKSWPNVPSAAELIKAFPGIKAAQVKMYRYMVGRDCELAHELGRLRQNVAPVANRRPQAGHGLGPFSLP